MPSPQQPSLLRVERHEDQRMVRLMLFEIRSDRKQRRRARSIIVRPVIDLAVSDPVVVIVCGNNDVLVRVLLSLYLPDKIYAFQNFVRSTLLYVKFLSDRLQARFPQSLLDIIASFLDRRPVGRAAFHIVCRKHLDIASTAGPRRTSSTPGAAETAFRFPTLT